LREGRTWADARVLQSLFEVATGYSHPETKVHFDKYGDVHTFDMVKHYKPDVEAIKMWMTNRQKDTWRTRQDVGVHGGAGDKSPVGVAVKNETKEQLVSSILSLIQPKPIPDA
jgi:uncharacterized SAM-dependent methyltransferase